MALALDLLRKLLSQVFFLRLLTGFLRGGGEGIFFRNGGWMRVAGGAFCGHQ
jgi:hypothetical protein